MSDDFAELGENWDRYTQYLQSVHDALPPEVAAFAGALWRYKPTDHRSCHDAWVESMQVREDVEGSSEAGGHVENSQAHRRINIDVTLLGPYHDGHTTLSYRDVA